MAEILIILSRSFWWGGYGLVKWFLWVIWKVFLQVLTFHNLKTLLHLITIPLYHEFSITLPPQKSSFNQFFHLSSPQKQSEWIFFLFSIECTTDWTNSFQFSPKVSTENSKNIRFVCSKNKTMKGQASIWQKLLNLSQQICFSILYWFWRRKKSFLVHCLSMLLSINHGIIVRVAGICMEDF